MKTALQIRVSIQERDEIRSLAKVAGLSVSEFVRGRALEAALGSSSGHGLSVQSTAEAAPGGTSSLVARGSAPEQCYPDSTAGAPASPRAPERADLAVWLAGRTGLPRSICRMKIATGKVTVGGDVVTNVDVPGPIRDVTLDGDPQ